MSTAKIRAAILAGLMLIATTVALAVPATASAQSGYRVCVARNIDTGGVYAAKVRKGDTAGCIKAFNEMEGRGLVYARNGQFNTLGTCERFTQAWLNNGYGGDVCIGAPMTLARIYWVTPDRYLVVA